MVLQGQQWYVCLEAEERLERKALVSVTIPAADLHWHKRGREAVIDGKLFDVKTMRQTGGQIVLTGLFDEAETAIVNLLEQQTTHSRESNGMAYLFILLLQFIALPYTFAFLSYRVAQPAVGGMLPTGYRSPFLPLAAPPPRG